MKNNIIIKVLLFVILAIVASVYFLDEPSSLSNATLYLAAPLIFALAGLYATRLYGHGSDSGIALFFISLGASCWLLGEIIWYVFKFFMDKSPFPSVADAFFLLAYPLFFIAIYKGLESIKNEWRKIGKATLISNLIIAVILALAVAYWGIYKVYDPEAGSLENIFSISYGVGDLFLILGVLWTSSLVGVYGNGKLGRFWKIMGSGFFLFLLADILFAIYQEKYISDMRPYNYIDIIWVAGYLILAYGLLEKALLINSIKEKIGINQREI